MREATGATAELLHRSVLNLDADRVAEVLITFREVTGATAELLR